MMKKTGIKRWFSILLCLLMLCLTACSAEAPLNGDGRKVKGEKEEKEQEEEKEEEEEEEEEEDTEEADAAPAESFQVGRPGLLKASLPRTNEAAVQAAAESIEIAKDFSNVINADQFYLEEKERKHLLEDGFYVTPNAGSEFFGIYEDNRYFMTPNFITVDSLMHTYHLYFSFLLKQTEKNSLTEKLSELTDIMLANSIEQGGMMALSSAKKTDLSESFRIANERNTAFFVVAKALLDPSWKPEKEEGLSDEVLMVAEAELKLINEAGGIADSPLMDGAEMEDYSQYKPRGYYDTDEGLSRYFKAMMWYGRRNFSQKDELSDMSALLMSLSVDEEAYEDWEAIYAVTSFFAGASDDNGICEYIPLIEEAYGEEPSKLDVADLARDEKGWESFHKLTGELQPPAINSVPMPDDEGKTDKTEENKGFRFMGQRFSIDEAIFQKLTYSSVKENSSGDKRMLPDALDVPAVLGSEVAYQILDSDLDATDFEKYTENYETLKKGIEGADESLWNASLYAAWIDTLRPLLDEKPAGYPAFMQNENWLRKDLECFLGSFTELKHDTVLYSKQMIAEMGGGDEEPVDDRGYVEPEPLVFSRFTALSQGTMEGLAEFDMLSEDARRDLTRLSELSESLRVIAEKELTGEPPTEDEFELIRIYGGEIEHFWQEVYKDEAEGEYFTSQMFPAALAVDVATDPNGSVLQLANGNPSLIMVVVPVEGKLRIARGSVYAFYQFEQPIDQRLTDHEWRVMLGIDPDDNGEFHWESPDVQQPAWTEPYRIQYDY